MKPKRVAPLVWVGFLHALTSSFLAGLVMWLLSLIVGYTLGENVFYAFALWAETPLGITTVSLVSLLVLLLASYNQARFIRERYEYPDAAKVALHAVVWFAGISVAFFVLDLWDGYAWAWTDFLVEGLAILLFYLASRKFLRVRSLGAPSQSRTG